MSEAKTLLQIAGIPNAPSKLSDAALLLIDIQGEYLPTGNVPLQNVEAAIGSAKELLERARAAHTPVIHVVHNGPEGKGFYDPAGPGGKIVPEVAPVEGEPVIVKHHISAFKDTNLADEIQKTGKKELIVAGFMTHMCVSTTVRAAVEQYGLKCTVVGNATGSRALPAATSGAATVDADAVHRGNLAALSDYFACVVDSPSQISN
eukprot:TRINITY_DN861_c0_g1_i4.p2 TRINITY_DN861_c0_g1~~TRINITY_DN861_c0_g1_i4.p2  ORF type:complete len:205 (-),score=69.34 TRINITY_DN861_c0_g1_i4:130-744(-)